MKSPATGFVIYDQERRVVTLTLNNPDELNAIGSQQACNELVSAIERIERDPSVSAVILTGAGKAFCSGGNLRNLAERSDFARGANPAATRDNYRRGVQRLIRALWNVEVPTIAAVNGAAVGLGCDIACACDIRIAADSATFAAGFLRVGLIPGDGGAWFLPRVVGFSKAAEMLFTGEKLSATEARALGLVSKVSSAEQLLVEARALASRISANPPQALRLCKRLLRESQHASLDTMLELSASFQALVQESTDHAEALAAALEKRAPMFRGY